MPDPAIVNSRLPERAELERIAATLSPLYTEALNSTHPFVAKMQPVNPVELVEHILREATKGGHVAS